MTKDALGSRMKIYENVYRSHLVRRVPAIIRLDGKAFHTFTRGMERPFDGIMVAAMQETMRRLCENIQGCVLGYAQSDEITLVLTDYDKPSTQGWMDYGVQKMASVSASMCTAFFNAIFREKVEQLDDCLIRKWDYRNRLAEKVGRALFDSRAFNMPKDEVCNLLIWRQQDAVRNSIEMVGRAWFSHSQLMNVSCSGIQDMLMERHDVNWNDYPTEVKRGSCAIQVTVEEPLDDEVWTRIVDGLELGAELPNRMVTRRRWVIDREIPIFTQNRDYVNSRIGYKET